MVIGSFIIVLLSLALGAIAHWLFGISFWIAAGITLAAIIVNGVIAFREDRGTFND